MDLFLSTKDTDGLNNLINTFACIPRCLVSICKVSSNKYSANLSSISLKTSQTIRKKKLIKYTWILEYFLNLKKKPRENILINNLNKDNLQINLNKFHIH